MYPPKTATKVLILFFVAITLSIFLISTIIDSNYTPEERKINKNRGGIVMNTNVVILSGRLTRDPELRYTTSGKAVANFTLAVNRTKEEADFIPIIIWETAAENAAKFLVKGSKVIVTGKITTRKWEDKDKNKRTTTEIVATRLEFIGGTKPPDKTQETTEFDNNIPF